MGYVRGAQSDRAGIDTIRILIEVVIFGLAAGGLVAAGRPNLAWTLLIVFAINDALLYAWGQ